MLFLAAEDPEKDISLYINSPAVRFTAGLAILDTMRLVEPESCILAHGARRPPWEAVLLGLQNQRQALHAAHSRILIHQPSMSGSPVRLTEYPNLCQGSCACARRLNQILASTPTGQPVDKIRRMNQDAEWGSV